MQLKVRIFAGASFTSYYYGRIILRRQLSRVFAFPSAYALLSSCFGILVTAEK